MMPINPHGGLCVCGSRAPFDHTNADITADPGLYDCRGAVNTRELHRIVMELCRLYDPARGFPEWTDVVYLYLIVRTPLETLATSAADPPHDPATGAFINLADFRQTWTLRSESGFGDKRIPVSVEHPFVTAAGVKTLLGRAGLGRKDHHDYFAYTHRLDATEYLENLAATLLWDCIDGRKGGDDDTTPFDAVKGGKLASRFAEFVSPLGAFHEIDTAFAVVAQFTDRLTTGSRGAGGTIRPALRRFNRSVYELQLVISTVLRHTISVPWSDPGGRGGELIGITRTVHVAVWLNGTFSDHSIQTATPGFWPLVPRAQHQLNRHLTVVEVALTPTDALRGGTAYLEGTPPRRGGCQLRLFALAYENRRYRSPARPSQVVVMYDRGLVPGVSVSGRPLGRIDDPCQVLTAQYLTEYNAYLIYYYTGTAGDPYAYSLCASLFCAGDNGYRRVAGGSSASIYSGRTTNGETACSLFARSNAVLLDRVFFGSTGDSFVRCKITDNRLTNYPPHTFPGLPYGPNIPVQHPYYIRYVPLADFVGITAKFYWSTETGAGWQFRTLRDGNSIAQGVFRTV